MNICLNTELPDVVNAGKNVEVQPKPRKLLARQKFDRDKLILQFPSSIAFVGNAADKCDAVTAVRIGIETTLEQRRGSLRPSLWRHQAVMLRRLRKDSLSLAGLPAVSPPQTGPIVRSCSMRCQLFFCCASLVALARLRTGQVPPSQSFANSRKSKMVTKSRCSTRT